MLPTPNNNIIAGFIERFMQDHWMGDQRKSLQQYLGLDRARFGLSTDRANVYCEYYCATSNKETDDVRRELVQWAISKGYLMQNSSRASGTYIYGIGRQTVDLMLNLADEGRLIYVAGDPAVVAATRRELETQVFPKGKAITIFTLDKLTESKTHWNDSVIKNEPMDLERFRVFYPYFDAEDLLFEDYLASAKAVLFLYGPPGVGKSTLLRSLIRTSNRNAWLVTNEMHFDQPGFIGALTETPRNDLIVVEDADRLVRPRSSGNSIMAPLLSMTSGIEEKPRKMAISTNLETLSKVDPALYRRGRTYRVLKFELLTAHQANAAREYMDLPGVNFDRQHLSLADALNWEDDLDNSSRTANRVGFVNN